MIKYLIGAILGGLGAYVYTSSPRFQKQIAGKAKKIKALGEGFRMPLPATVVELPVDLEDFQELDATICDCVGQLQPDMPADLDPNEAILAFQACVALEFYGPEEVQWPPAPGDHPSIHQLWGIIGYRIRRLTVRGELAQLCGPMLTPAPIPEQPADPGLQPGEVPVDDWGEPQQNDMMDNGSVGGPEGGLWRVYKDNTGQWQGLFYFKIWKKGAYNTGGPFNTGTDARAAAITAVTAQRVGTSPKPNPWAFR